MLTKGMKCTTRDRLKNCKTRTSQMTGCSEYIPAVPIKIPANWEKYICKDCKWRQACKITYSSGLCFSYEKEHKESKEDAKTLNCDNCYRICNARGSNPSSCKDYSEGKNEETPIPIPKNPLNLDDIPIVGEYISKGISVRCEICNNLNDCKKLRLTDEYMKGCENFTPKRHAKPEPGDCDLCIKYDNCKRRQEMIGITGCSDWEIPKKKGNQSKIEHLWTDMDADTMLRIANISYKGCEKYGEDNWKHISPKDHLNHAITHIFKELAGNTDEDNLAHAAWRLIACMGTLKKGEHINAENSSGRVHKQD